MFSRKKKSSKGRTDEWAVLDGGSISHVEEEIYSSDIIPKDYDRFMKYFISSMEDRQIRFPDPQRVNIFDIEEVEGGAPMAPRFKLLGMTNCGLTFDVKFEEAEGKLKTYYKFTFALDDNVIPNLQKDWIMNELAKTEILYRGLLSEQIESVVKQSLKFIENAPELRASNEPRAPGDGRLVFISYATKDAGIFNIEKIASELTKVPEIFDVLYWQEDMKDNIIEYMSDNLGKSDVVLLFCSPNSLESEPVKKEWTSADAMGKPIIPVFLKPDHIPPLLRSRLGMEFDQFDIDKNIHTLHDLILKKTVE